MNASVGVMNAIMTPNSTMGNLAADDSSTNNTDQLLDEYGMPALPWDMDTSDFDYVQYLPNLDAIKSSWTDDRAFWPTSLTYGIAFLIGVVGNSLVMFALLVDKKSRNVTASFLVSLAAADLLFLLMCIPYETSAKFTGYWAGGLALCKIMAFVEMLSASASILNLTAVSVERYIVIVHPMRSRTWCTMGNTKRIVSGVWVVAVLLSSPVLYIMSTTANMYYNNASYVTVMTCGDSNVRHDDERIVFAWYQLIVMFIVPTLVMVYCYSVVIHVLWLSTKELAKMTRANGHRDDDDASTRLTSTSTAGGSSSRGGGGGAAVTARAKPPQFSCRGVKDQSAEVREARKQVIKMLLTIIGVFLLCWGPKLILNILKRHHQMRSVLHTDEAFFIMLVIHLLPYIQSAINPIIYGFMSNNFRQSMRAGCRSCSRYVPCCCCPCLFPPSSTTSFNEVTSRRKNDSSYSSRFSPTYTRNGGGHHSMTMVSEC